MYTITGVNSTVFNLMKEVKPAVPLPVNNPSGNTGVIEFSYQHPLTGAATAIKVELGPTEQIDLIDGEFSFKIVSTLDFYPRFKNLSQPASTPNPTWNTDGKWHTRAPTKEMTFLVKMLGDPCMYAKIKPTVFATPPTYQIKAT